MDTLSDSRLVTPLDVARRSGTPCLDRYQHWLLDALARGEGDSVLTIRQYQVDRVPIAEPMFIRLLKSLRDLGLIETSPGWTPRTTIVVTEAGRELIKKLPPLQATIGDFGTRPDTIPVLSRACRHGAELRELTAA